MQLNKSIVIDNGSLNCYAGFGGEEAPRVLFKSVIGKSKYKTSMVGAETKQIYVGEQAIQKKDLLLLKYPIQNGIITDWDNYQKVLYHCFCNQMRSSPSQYNLLLTEAARNPKKNSQKLMQLIFQQFQAPSFGMATSSSLALYSAGLTNGVVLDIGDGVIQSVPILKQGLLKQGVQRYNFGGNDLTEYMKRLLNEIGLYFETSGDLDLVRDIKQKLCYVAQDFEIQSKQSRRFPIQFEKSFQLPDRTVFTLNNQRFRCSELLFKPSIIYKEIPGIHQIVVESIRKCQSDTHKLLSKNILLVGGGSLIDGLPERLLKQIEGITLTGTTPNIVAKPQRKFMNWIGGSIVTAIGTFKDNWITKKEYNERGSEVLHRKRFL